MSQNKDVIYPDIFSWVKYVQNHLLLNLASLTLHFFVDYVIYCYYVTYLADQDIETHSNLLIVAAPNFHDILA
jgi:hypothetical protein